MSWIKIILQARTYTAIACLLPALALSTAASALEENDSELQALTDFYVLTAMYHASRDPALESTALQGLEMVLDKRADWLLESAPDNADMIMEIAQGRLSGDTYQEYSAQDMVTIREELGGVIASNQSLGDYCTEALNSACYEYIRYRWARIMSSYTFRATDPSGMTGDSYYIEGESDLDIFAELTELSVWIERLEKSDNPEWRSAGLKMGFIQSSAIRPESRAVPFIAVRYLADLYIR